MTVNDALHDRDNNFNLLRFVAAFIVLVGHVSYLTWGEHAHQTYFEYLVGDSAGVFAVNAFFAMSGFLVTKSLMTRDNAFEYVAARALRLFPALITLTLLVAYVVGPLVTNNSPWSYLAAWETTRFWVSTSTTFSVFQSLPGVFTTNPVPDVVIGPLWTLKWEVLAYVGLLVLWACGLVQSRRRFLGLCVVFLAAYLVATYTLDIRVASEAMEGAFLVNAFRFSACFLVGALLYQFRDIIPLNGYLALTFLGTAYALHHNVLFDVSAVFAVGYGVVWLALVPTGVVRQFNRLGDYSYGIYIYHWPVIQTLVALDPGLEGPKLLLLSSLLTLAAAVCSWHLVEKPALSMKPLITSAWKKVALRASKSKPAAGPTGTVSTD